MFFWKNINKNTLNFGDIAKIEFQTGYLAAELSFSLLKTHIDIFARF